MTPESKKQTVKKAYDLAFIYAPRHHSCSLGTLLALQEAFEIKEENVFKAASGLRGGIARKGSTCGSFLGASLMLGVMCGSTIEESGAPKEHYNPEESELPVRLVGELYDWFKTEFGTLTCDEIVAQYKQELDAAPDTKGLSNETLLDRMHDKCHILCAKTAARAAEMLWDEIHKGKTWSRGEIKNQKSNLKNTNQK
jgi:C_GCAxxG_C_C family probable redox protein